MKKLYKEYYEEICDKLSKDLDIPKYKIKRVLSCTFDFYRRKIWEDKFDDAIKILNIGKFIPTILSKKKKGLIPLSKKSLKEYENDFNKN